MLSGILIYTLFKYIIKYIKLNFYMKYSYIYSRNIVTEKDAIKMLRENQLHKEEMEKKLQSKGYSTYTADVGWWSPQQAY